MTVLIIDDTAPLAALMGDAFRDEGYEVDIAVDGRIGLDLFEHGHHDLIVTDLLMPEFDGLEIIRGIRRIDRASHLASKVIAISGGGLLKAQIHLQTAERLGADATLAKPFLPSDLVDLGAELLHGHRVH